MARLPTVRRLFSGTPWRKELFKDRIFPHFDFENAQPEPEQLYHDFPAPDQSSHFNEFNSQSKSHQSHQLAVVCVYKGNAAAHFLAIWRPLVCSSYAPTTWPELQYSLGPHATHDRLNCLFIWHPLTCSYKPLLIHKRSHVIGALGLALQRSLYGGHLYSAYLGPCRHELLLIMPYAILIYSLIAPSGIIYYI